MTLATALQIALESAYKHPDDVSKGELGCAGIELARAVQVYQWARGPGWGASAGSIVQAITGIQLTRLADEWTPRDEVDFGRCLDAVKHFGFRSSLHKVAAAYPSWIALVDAWDELEALYREDRERLRERLEELRKAKCQGP